MTLHGVVNINKPRGWTSHDAVSRVKRLSGARRAGHSGTLDPEATGVLLVLLGEACKASSLFMNGDKTYRAGIRLGYSSTTLDAAGEITRKEDFRSDERSVFAAVEQFMGQYNHAAPSYSAKKYRGQKFYEIARKGGTPPERIQRSVIKDIRLESYEPPDLRISVTCTSGTYIRTLASDIARSLGTDGYLTSLERSASGTYSIESSSAPEEGEWEKGFTDINRVLRDLPCVTVNSKAAAALRHGIVFTAADVTENSGDTENGVFAVFSPEMEVKALALRDGPMFRLSRVFNL